MNGIDIRRLGRARIIIAAAVAVIFGAAGVYFLAASNAQAPGQAPLTVPAEEPTPSLLRPASLGVAPYQYIAYSGSVDRTRQQTGVKDYFAAFIIGDGTCTPTWGGNPASGLTSPRSTEIAADFAKLRAQGGDVAVSFGGSDGTELAVACGNVEQLTAAYRQVARQYSLTRIDLDIEGPALSDKAATARRAAAIAALQKSDPELKIWVTLPVHDSGLTADGQAVITAFRDAGAVLSGINIMAMNYSIGALDMGAQAIKVSEASQRQIRGIYPELTDAEVWKGLGIIVMAGHNNTMPETFTLQDAAELQQFALNKGVGLLSVWNANRDKACTVGTTGPEPRVDCSGVSQQPYDYIEALTIPPVR